MGGIASLGAMPGESPTASLHLLLVLAGHKKKISDCNKRGSFKAGLFLVIPFSMLAQHMDRRLLLVFNAVSQLCGNVFMITMGKSSH